MTCTWWEPLFFAVPFISFFGLLSFLELNTVINLLAGSGLKLVPPMSGLNDYYSKMITKWLLMIGF